MWKTANHWTALKVNEEWTFSGDDTKPYFDCSCLTQDLSFSFKMINYEDLRFKRHLKNLTSAKKNPCIRIRNDSIHLFRTQVDYQTTTIISQFNIAHFIIYPLRNGLFRVQIAQRFHHVPLLLFTDIVSILSPP
eukprot:TRINITY_DN20094_c0_g2_i1.p1 TRINITY_DN20094_c0_g2~~TRINITY_DN20094_c0_g2_i1.p1  ORF type:complete len:134 (-),score=12.63 TRINITY_DN20094_c0_g2_i1:9-410(-)